MTIVLTLSSTIDVTLAPELITCIRYSTIETKEAARIGYNGFLFQHEYSGEGRAPEYSCGKRNPLYPIWENSFVSIIIYLTCINNINI